MAPDRTEARALAPAASCPCGLGAVAPAGPVPPYAQCCGRYHEGPLQGEAPTAEALMRSRYTAFVLERADYLLASWHPRTRPAAIAPSPPDLRWLGLEVRGHRVEADGAHATVEFIARSKRGGRAHRHHETSRFVREQGRWFYLDAAQGP